MTPTASLHLLISRLIERTLGWGERITRTDPRERDDDDFYDIFMFGPHG